MATTRDIHMHTKFSVTRLVEVETEDLPGSHSNLSTSENRSRISCKTGDRSGILQNLDNIDHDSDISPPICSLDCDVAAHDSDCHWLEFNT